MSGIQILTPAQQDAARKAGCILRECLIMLNEHVQPGISTQELDTIAENYITARGGKPAFKGYQGYTATLCTSVNEQCVHGIPGTRVLVEGDSISLDCGVLMDGIYTDACVTYGVGKISKEAQQLIDITSQALDLAVSLVHAGIRTGDISSAIQTFVEDHGFKPVRSLTGHGLGNTLHQPPDIPNIGRAGTGLSIPAGALIAIEPIVSAGDDEVREAGDGWTLSITDGGLAAHCEHTVLVTEEGCEIIA